MENQAGDALAFHALRGMIFALALGWAALASGAPQSGQPLQVSVPQDNPQSPDKVALGAQLYFDTRLSGDDSISCATCHSPSTGWANHRATDIGIKGQVGSRNSGTILNAAFMEFQFWDGRARSLEAQALGPIHNPIEMGETTGHVIPKLNAVPGYRTQFRTVFGTNVTEDGIAKAIAAFERTVITGSSPYDRYLAGEKGALAADARRGLAVFSGKGRCVLCHGGPMLSDRSFHNLGVGMNRPSPDIGREAVTRLSRDRGRFKTPSLRNVALTWPYLHDGSAGSLDDVLDLYVRGGEPNPNLDPMIRPVPLTGAERADLKAFLTALTGTLPLVREPSLPPGEPGR